MNAPVSPWLPREALGDGRAERLIAPMLAEWSRTWFARARPAPLVAAAEAAPDADWRGRSEGIAFAADAAARLRLAGLMLDTDPVAEGLRPADRDLIERLCDAALGDLGKRLARGFGLAEAPAWTPQAAPGAGGLTLAVGSEERPLFHLYVSDGLLAGLIKRACTVPDRPPRLSPLAVPLAAQPVGLSAALGRCSLTLAELAGLGEGDVLVLDRPLDRPLELVVEGAKRTSRCTLDQEGERLRLRLLEPLG